MVLLYCPIVYLPTAEPERLDILKYGYIPEPVAVPLDLPPVLNPTLLKLIPIPPLLEPEGAPTNIPEPASESGKESIPEDVLLQLVVPNQ